MHGSNPEPTFPDRFFPLRPLVTPEPSKPISSRRSLGEAKSGKEVARKATPFPIDIVSEGAPCYDGLGRRVNTGHYLLLVIDARLSSQHKALSSSAVFAQVL